jgi:hypothetical protein
MIIYISKIVALGQFLKIKCGLGINNNVTFLEIKIHYKNVLIETNATRPKNCNEEHWENMKRLNALEAKQDHSMWASYSYRGGEKGVARS